jgi:hypothetical protein
MNGEDGSPDVVTARLPSGALIRVELADTRSDDAMTAVGLRDLELGGALDTVAEIGSAVVKRLKTARPAKAMVELRLGFSVESGKLVALWVGGKGEASLTVTLEWSPEAADAIRPDEGRPGEVNSAWAEDPGQRNAAGQDG